ncbi:hypothetical protein MJG53_004694 [Ovis ammon polii x Ovis aries]|uniref:Uncharacterized protein n=1 Tax=Ovis ammon polii x Ovis aries TaxID=2918886 RepID=A0ACB9VAG8_9CETA|nr:hypothetical protein MJG53_004694 [Ovis ammon polii x Ovis aries]
MRRLSTLPWKCAPGAARQSPLAPLPLDSERALDTAESVELRMGPDEERALPVPQHLEKGSLPQASFPRRGDHPAPSHTPGPPGPQREELHQNRFYEHRRSSVVLNLPGLEVFPGDLLVSAGAADYLCHPLLLLNSVALYKSKHLTSYQIFMNTLKYLQTHEYLLDVDLWRLFANLEELSQTSFGFVSSLFRIFKDYIDICETSPSLDFISVLTKWCEQNDQCRRLHLPELLVAPLHRLTRYPLLLKNIWKRSTDSTEKIMIYSIKEKVEKSIRDLEGKVKWLDSFQKFRHLQEIVVWPPLWDRDKRFFIPECLKHIFKEHMAENILSPTNRHLLYEGKLTLAESTRFLDVYLFLFDDFLLVTKTKRNKKKLGGSDPGLMCPSLTPELQTVIKEGGSCTVIDQPIPLDRLVVRGLDSLHVSVFGLRNAFLIQHENRYRQCIAAFLLQAQTENIKIRL